MDEMREPAPPGADVEREVPEAAAGSGEPGSASVADEQEAAADRDEVATMVDSTGQADSADEAESPTESGAPDVFAPLGSFSEVEELGRRLAEAEDARLRSLAEVDNIQKRFERVRADAKRYGGVPLARDLLKVADALDRLESSIDDGFRSQSPAFVEGVELILKLLMEAFERHGIEVVHPEKGDALDLDRHESMFREIDESVEPGHIVRVVEKGFMFRDRLLRAARVSVADPPPPQAAATSDEDAAGPEEPEESEPENGSAA